MIKSSCAYSVELFDIINIIFKIPEFKKDQIFSNMHLKYAYICGMLLTLNLCFTWPFTLLRSMRIRRFPNVPASLPFVTFRRLLHIFWDKNRNKYFNHHVGWLFTMRQYAYLPNWIVTHTLVHVLSYYDVEVFKSLVSVRCLALSTICFHSYNWCYYENSILFLNCEIYCTMGPEFIGFLFIFLLGREFDRNDH